MHTDHSGDSETPPEEAAAWYASHSYDFIVFTDHNRITDTPDLEGMLTLRGVELTQNLRTCDPPPAPGQACLLHVDALFVTGPTEQVIWPEPTPVRRLDLYARAVDMAGELGAIAQLNHPNFHFAADAEIAVALAARGMRLIEIANQAVDSANDGDAAHPSTEQIWDTALARGARLFATATDDAHHYDDADRVRARGETAYVGDRGFVMVRARKEPSEIRDAIARGDFYASTGLLLDRAVVSATSIDLEVAGGRTVDFEVIGTGGVVLEKRHGPRLELDPRPGPPGYVRIRATDDAGHRAWTQPVFR